NNRVFNSADTGILMNDASTVSGNVVYSNSVGIQYHTRFGAPVIRNNLVYANAVRGIWVRGGSGGPVVESNTVYQPAGDALRIEGDASGSGAFNARVRNNILWSAGA